MNNSVHKFDNLGEMDQSSKSQSTKTQTRRNTLKRSVSIFKKWISNLKLSKAGPDDFTGEWYQTKKKQYQFFIIPFRIRKHEKHLLIHSVSSSIKWIYLAGFVWGLNRIKHLALTISFFFCLSFKGKNLLIFYPPRAFKS